MNLFRHSKKRKIFVALYSVVFLLSIFLAQVLVSPSFSLAQSQNNFQSQQNTQTSNSGTEYKYQLHEKIPGQESEESVDDLQSYLEALYRFGIAIVAILAVVMIGIGAFMYIVTSAGSVSKITNAKEIIGNAIFGLVLALLSWLILYVINPDLVATTLKKPSEQISTDSYVGDGNPDPEICRNDKRDIYQMGLCSGNKACVKNECKYLIDICLHSNPESGNNMSEDSQKLATSVLCQSFLAKPGDFCGSIANGGTMLGKCTSAGVTDCEKGSNLVSVGVQCLGDSVCCAKPEAMEYQ